MCLTFQRACYLSLNPQKDETLETEKAQYVLPDGSTLNVSWSNTDQSYFGKTLNNLTPLHPHYIPWTLFSDWTGQVPCSRAAFQTRPDRRRKFGDPRGFGLRYPEVWYGPQTHTVLHHSTVWRIDTDQRFMWWCLCESGILFNSVFYFLCTESKFFPLGFGERLLTEVKKLAPKDVKIKVGSDW